MSTLALKLSEIGETMMQGLGDPNEMLDLLLSALARGEQPLEAWRRLHEATAQHGKLHELSRAYEQLANEKRVRLLAAEQQAFVHLRAAEFFAGVVGDRDAAFDSAERAVLAMPGQPQIYPILDWMREVSGESAKLARLYAEAATREADAGAKAELLRRAGEIVARAADSDDAALDVGRRVLELDPANEELRGVVVQRLIARGRHHDVVELLERALAREPAPGFEEATLLREWLVDLCLSTLRDPLRAIGYIEGLLSSYPQHELAHKAAESLLDNRQVALRAASALSDAYEKLGAFERAVAMLSFELKNVRGPRRMEVQRRLAILRQDVLFDPAGALEMLGPVVAADPGNDELRARYVSLSTSQNQLEPAARLLTRALQTSRDPAIRARVGVDVGHIYLKSGDLRRATAIFRQVLEAGQDEPSLLEASRRLAELLAEPSDQKQLLMALEHVVRLESDIDSRQAAARRLVRLADVEGGDPARAMTAWRALIGSPWSDEALRRLETLYTEAGDQDGLSELMFHRADTAADPEEAFGLSLGAAELRAAHTRDPELAAAAWQRHLARFGPARDIHARVIPLLEQAQRYDELCAMLLADAALSEGEERVLLLMRAAQLRRDLLADRFGALEALAQVLMTDPVHPEARAAVERLLGSPDVRVAAARALEPILRAEGPSAALLAVLEARAESDPDPSVRLAYFDEAGAIAFSVLRDPARALELHGRALFEAVTFDPSSLFGRLDRFRELAAMSGNPARRAELLAQALDDRSIDSNELLALAKAAGEALAAAGELEPAIETYRRALAFDPEPRDLVRRIDDLLAQQRAPEERLQIYRASLEGEFDRVRRRELLHAMANVQGRELGDARAAVETWRRALSEDAMDQVAHQALVELLIDSGDLLGAREELARLLPLVEGDRQRATLLRLAEVELRGGDANSALERYRSLLKGDLPDEVLDVVERLAREQGDGATVRTAVERRLEREADPSARGGLFERLGNALAWQLNDEKAAAAAWLQGVRAGGSASDDRERAKRLCSRVLDVDPLNREAAERLFHLCAEIGDWPGAQVAFKILERVLEERELVTLVLELKQPALERAERAPFVALLELLLLRPLAAARKHQVELTRARVLSSEPGDSARACRAYRALIEAGGDDAPAIAEELATFLSSPELTSAHAADARWLFAWRVEHSSDPASTLLEWARAEAGPLGDTERAIELFQSALERDPERSDALQELAELQLKRGDTGGAVAVFETLRARMDPEQRGAVDLSMAELLVGIPGRAEEALEVVRPILQANPADAGALRVVHRALSVTETRSQAAAMLEQVAEGSEDPAARADLIAALLTVTAEAPELSEARSRWLLQLVETKTDAPEEALRLALRGAEAAPGEDALWTFAEQMARKSNQPGPVAEAYARALADELPADVANVLGRRIVEFHEEWFDEPDRVVQLLERVLLLCPAALWAFDRLKLAFNAASRFSDLFALYDRRLQTSSDPVEQVELLREAAMAARDFAADPERAIGYFERLHRAAPDDARVESSLERLYERHGRKRALIELLSARLAGVKPKEAGELSGRIAALWLDLDEPTRAFELAVAMAERKADLDAAVLLLERIVALPASAQALLDEGDSVRERAARRLERHYRKRKSTLDVIRMLEIEAETAAVPDRIKLLEEVVSLRLGEPEDVAGAFDTLVRLVELGPADSERRARFAQIAARVQAADRRADTLERVAEQDQPAPLRSWLLAEAADVCRVDLVDRERAQQLYRRVLAVAGADSAAALHAARELSRMLRDDRATAELVSVLEVLAELEPGEDAKRAALGEAAEAALGELSDAGRAVRAWQRRLELDSEDLPAVDGLCRALERAERWDELVAGLGVRARIAPDATQALGDRKRIAEIHEAVKADRAQAIEAWREVQQHHGFSRESFDALERLLAEESRFGELAQLLSDEVTRESDAERRRALQRELGLVHQTRTLDVLAALHAFVRAEDWDKAIEVAGANHADRAFACEVCARLLELSTDAWKSSGASAESPAARAADWAVTELSNRLLDSGRYAEVVSQLLAAAELGFETHRRRELRRDAARLSSDRLSDAQRAITLFQGLLAEDPGDDVAQSVVGRLASLLEEQGDFAELALLWERQARARVAAEDAAGAATLWARAGEIAERKLLDLERAISAYTQGAKLGGEASLEALARIYTTRGEPEQASHVLEALCAQSSPEALGDRAQRLADAYIACGAPKRARACLERAAGIVVDATELRARLATLYREASDFAALAQLLGEEAERAGDKRAKLSLLREAAELHIEQRADPNAAVPLLERAIALEPDEQKLRLRLAQALYRTTRYDEAVEVLRTQIERYGARRPKERALAHFQLARVLLAAGREADALLELDLASKIDPANPGIMQMLARVALEQNELDRAEKMYRSLLLVLGRDDDPEGPSKAEALSRLAEIAARRGDEVRAGEFMESAFEAALENSRDAAALEVELRAQKRFDLLVRSLESRLARGLPPKEAARALSDLVAAHAEGLGDLERVRGSLEARARQLQGELESAADVDEAAWSALSRTYEWLGDSAAEASVLERRVFLLQRSGRTPEDGELFYRLARVRLRDPKNLEQGLDLLERALDVEPDFARASELLGAMQASAPAARVAAILERIARATGDDAALANALLLQLDGPSASFGRVQEAVLAAQRTGDQALVERLLTRALGLELADASSADSAWLRLALADLSAGRGDALGALVLREQAASFLPGTEARTLLLSIAQQYSELDSHRPRAIAVYEELLRSDPGDRGVWEPLLILLRSSGESERLARLLHQVVPLIDDVAERSQLRIEHVNVLLGQEGQVANVIELLQEIVRDDSNQRDAARLLSELLEQEGRLEELVELLRQEIDLAKDAPDVASIVALSLRLIEALTQRGLVQEASDACRAALEWAPTRRELLEKLLTLAEANDDPVATSDALEGLLQTEQGPSAARLAQRLAKLREGLGDHDGALKALESAFAANPSDAELCELLAARFNERGEHERVAELLSHALRERPGERALRERLVQAYRAAQNMEGALQTLDAMLSSEPDNGGLLRARAAVLSDLGREQEAVTALESAYARDATVARELVEALDRALSRAAPEQEFALLLRLAQVLEESGDLEGARARLNELVGRSPDQLAAQRQLAALEARSGNLDGAIRALSELCDREQGPELIETVLRLSEACARAERLDEARRALERALTVDRKHPEVRRRLSRVYEATGALRELGSLLTEDAMNEPDPATRFTLSLKAAELLLGQEGDPASALPLLESARQDNPESTEVVVLLARAYRSLGRAQDALALLNSIVAASRGRRAKGLGAVHGAIAQIHLDEGALGEALQALTRAFEFDPRNGELAMQLGQLAIDAGEDEVAQRAFRAVSIMKPRKDGETDGAPPDAKADANYYLALLAKKQGDPRKARVLATKALGENADHPAAKALLAEIDGRA